MGKVRDADELATLLVQVRRFFASWLTLLVSIGAGWLIFGAALELFALVTLPAGWDDGAIYAHPLALSVAWAFGAVIAGLVIGAPLVLLRSHIVHPDFPFLRLGYAGIAAIPFALFGMGWGSEPDWFWIPLYVQAPLLLTTFIYVVLARWFGLFAPIERSRRDEVGSAA